MNIKELSLVNKCDIEEFNNNERHLLSIICDFLLLLYRAYILLTMCLIIDEDTNTNVYNNVAREFQIPQGC